VAGWHAEPCVALDAAIVTIKMQAEARPTARKRHV